MVLYTIRRKSGNSEQDELCRQDEMPKDYSLGKCLGEGGSGHSVDIHTEVEMEETESIRDETREMHLVSVQGANLGSKIRNHF